MNIHDNKTREKIDADNPQFIPLEIELVPPHLFPKHLSLKHFPEKDGSILHVNGSGLWSLFDDSKPTLKFKSGGDWGLSIDVFPKTVPMFSVYGFPIRMIGKISQWKNIQMRNYHDFRERYPTPSFDEYRHYITSFDGENNIYKPKENMGLVRYHILLSEYPIKEISQDEVMYECLYTCFPDKEPLSVCTCIKNIIEALNRAGVNVTFSGKILESKHAPLLSGWFWESYERIYIFRRDGNETFLVCEGKTTWTMIKYGTS